MDITNLKISVSSFEESEMSIDEMTERINTDIENNKNSIKAKNEQIEQNKQEEENLRVQIEEFQSKN